jgi:hypothetical protein
VVIADFSVGFGRQTYQPKGDTDDDRPHMSLRALLTARDGLWLMTQAAAGVCGG